MAGRRSPTNQAVAGRPAPPAVRRAPWQGPDAPRRRPFGAADRPARRAGPRLRADPGPGGEDRRPLAAQPRVRLPHAPATRRRGHGHCQRRGRQAHVRADRRRSTESESRVADQGLPWEAMDRGPGRPAASAPPSAISTWPPRRSASPAPRRRSSGPPRSSPGPARTSTACSPTPEDRSDRPRLDRPWSASPPRPWDSPGGPDPGKPSSAGSTAVNDPSAGYQPVRPVQRRIRRAPRRRSNRPTAPEPVSVGQRRPCSGSESEPVRLVPAVFPRSISRNLAGRVGRSPARRAAGSLSHDQRALYYISGSALGVNHGRSADASHASIAESAFRAGGPTIPDRQRLAFAGQEAWSPTALHLPCRSTEQGLSPRRRFT